LTSSGSRRAGEGIATARGSGGSSGPVSASGGAAAKETSGLRGDLLARRRPDLRIHRLPLLPRPFVAVRALSVPYLEGAFFLLAQKLP